MKKFTLKVFVGTMVFGLTMFGLYYITSARNGLQATQGDSLTAAKWNELVSAISGVQSQITIQQSQINGMKRVDVSLSDTALFDTGCERRWYDSYFNVFYGSHIRGGGDRLFRRRDSSSADQGWWTIINTDKSHLRYRRSDVIMTNRLVFRIQKKCQN